MGLLQVIASFLSPAVAIVQGTWRWWKITRPARKVLEGIADNEERCRIFVRDYWINQNTPLFTREGTTGPVGTTPNVLHLWADVEGRALGHLLNALGQVGKSKNLDILPMSEDPGWWDSHIVVLGAQAQKCFDFYDRMEGVAFRVDATHIWDVETNREIPRDPGHGYGIILKARNPFLPGGKSGVGILIGGFGTLGVI